MDESKSGPPFKVGDRVTRKFFGEGRIDQITLSGGKWKFHVVFDNSTCLWAPAVDLERIPTAKERAN